MACPNCDHTMEGLGERVFWCPRCGTILQLDLCGTSHSAVPSLVRRVRQLRDAMGGAHQFGRWHSDHWRALGITEAVYPPGERVMAATD